MINDNTTWVEFSNWVISFPDYRIIEETNTLKKIIESDFMNESVLFDYVLSLYDLCRDECVRRFSSRIAADEIPQA